MDCSRKFHREETHESEDGVGVRNGPTIPNLGQNIEFSLCFPPRPNSGYSRDARWRDLRRHAGCVGLDLTLVPKKDSIKKTSKHFFAIEKHFRKIFFRAKFFKSQKKSKIEKSSFGKDLAIPYQTEDLVFGIFFTEILELTNCSRKFTLKDAHAHRFRESIGHGCR